MDGARDPLGLDALHLAERLDPALRLLRLGRLGAEALDEAFQLGDAPLLVVRAPSEQLALLRGLLYVAVEVAREKRQPARPQLGDVRGEPVEEPAVVADEDQAAGEALQEALEPNHGLEVEVVGRLVEQEHIRLLQQQAREDHPHLPAAAERAAVAVEVGRHEAEPLQDLLDAVLELEPAELLEAGLHDAVLRHQRVERPGRRDRHSVLQLAHALTHLEHVIQATPRLVPHRRAGERRDLLGQVAQRDPAGDAH